MNTYKGHRFPPNIIGYAVWLYYRFNLSHKDIEDLLAERGITVSHESIRLWCIKFGAKYARRLKRIKRGCGDTYFIDEILVKINRKQHYLWRAVDRCGVLFALPDFTYGGDRKEFVVDCLCRQKLGALTKSVSVMGLTKVVCLFQWHNSRWVE